ncbi:MAG: hypothetical protein NZT61_01965 [Deltaproteobacteria bacterium]|nr:hypothetical protein [Deltaproteobacteria bacterium]MCX7953418.1 hypothetical protein [Deltaproteobacteria bacterium]
MKFWIVTFLDVLILLTLVNFEKSSSNTGWTGKIVKKSIYGTEFEYLILESQIFELVLIRHDRRGRR